MKLVTKKNTFYALYALGAFIFFLWYLFPSDYFADYLEAQAKVYGNGMDVTIRDAGPSFPLALTMKGVECTIPTGARVVVDKMSIRPGIMALIRGNTEFSFSMDLFDGNVSGYVNVPENNLRKASFEDMEVSDVNLSLLTPFMAVYLPGYSIAGRLNARGSYSSEGRGTGMVNLDVKDLVVELEKPFFSVNKLTFNDISSEMEIKSKKLQIKECMIDGQEVGGSVKGSVFIRQPLDRSTLRISGTVKPDKKFLEELGKRVPVEGFIGKKMNADGEIPFRISGVAKSPRYSLQ